MRLELAVSKDIIKRKFDIDDKYNKLRDRLSKHQIIISNELLKTWEQDAIDNKYYEQFQNWYFSIINSQKKMKKVKTVRYNKVKEVRDHEDRMLIATAMASKDKIVVGNLDIKAKRKNRNVLFVSEGTFMREVSQTVNMNDVRKVIIAGKTHSIFDIYETPTGLEVELDSESEVLGMYLSKFVETSKTIKIQDRYIIQPENERNLNEYILKYVDKNITRLTFVLSENNKKEDIIERCTNYKGYKSNIEFIDKKETHHSLIETDEYIIDLGYRLRVFGDLDDGKTEHEVINITKKQTIRKDKRGGEICVI